MGRPINKLTCILIIALSLFAQAGRAQDDVINIVFTSDLHYGLTRTHFRGADSVSSATVNLAMIAAIDHLPELHIPADLGAGAGTKIGHIDALAITGDIANRAEKGIQNAATSWRQFETSWYHGLNIKDRKHHRTPLWLGPGNHDISNAIGYGHPLTPPRDPTAMTAMYDSMLRPARLRTSGNYNYNTDKIHYSRQLAGVHCIFINCWPDSAERQWMGKDLEQLPKGSPVLLFTHSMPDVESRFFTNPNGQHTINDTDKFENLLPEKFLDGTTFATPAIAEQRAFAAFLHQHPEIRGYFHGHSNYNEFYNWQGPDNDLALPCFRVDSPMKGKFSSKDETALSFQLISIDTHTGTMTVRECRWNTRPSDPSILEWGDHITISLK